MFFGIAGRLLYYVYHVLLLGPLFEVESSFNSLSSTALEIESSGSSTTQMQCILGTS